MLVLSKADAAVEIYTTSDGYKYLGAPTLAVSTAHYMDVGLYGTPGGHYSIGYAKFSANLAALTGAEHVYLAFNLRNFVAPVFGNGPAAQPTGYDYPTTGGDFSLKVVALSSAFTGTGVDASWATTNLFNPTAAGTVKIANAGINYVEITSTVANWIRDGATVKELGFIGIASTPNTWSLNIGTLEAQMDLDSNVISAASPMFLTTIPEPTLLRLLVCAVPLFWLARRRKRSR